MIMTSVLNKAGRFAVDLLYPPRCAVCGSHGTFLCRRCAESLAGTKPPRCSVCWEPCHASDLCDKCRTDTPAFAGLRSAYLFRDGVRELVHRLKYQHQASLVSPMSSLLYEYVADNPLPADVLVPVPLFPRRRRIRGYNQSALLAQGLARRLGLPVDDRTLVRARNTASQAETANAEARKLNVSGAFQCKGGALRSKRVLLIDDVATTGATLNACAKALREAGAASVWALTFARED